MWVLVEDFEVIRCKGERENSYLVVNLQAELFYSFGVFFADDCCCYRQFLVRKPGVEGGVLHSGGQWLGYLHQDEYSHLWRRLRLLWLEDG